jgi:hypothetical protein
MEAFAPKMCFEYIVLHRGLCGHSLTNYTSLIFRFQANAGAVFRAEVKACENLN